MSLAVCDCALKAPSQVTSLMVLWAHLDGTLRGANQSLKSVVGNLQSAVCSLQSVVYRLQSTIQISQNGTPSQTTIQSPFKSQVPQSMSLEPSAQETQSLTLKTSDPVPSDAPGPYDSTPPSHWRARAANRLLAMVLLSRNSSSSAISSLLPPCISVLTLLFPFPFPS